MGDYLGFVKGRVGAVCPVLTEGYSGSEPQIAPHFGSKV